MPAHVLRVKETDLAWYRFYTFVVTLDDDLNDRPCRCDRGKEYSRRFAI